MYRITRNLWSSSDEATGWEYHDPRNTALRKFPLVTKRGKVAWDDVLPLSTLTRSNTISSKQFQRRFGWGILYVKGKFKDNARKIAGNVVERHLPQGNGDAKVLDPSKPRRND